MVMSCERFARASFRLPVILNEGDLGNLGHVGTVAVIGDKPDPFREYSAAALNVISKPPLGNFISLAS